MTIEQQRALALAEAKRKMAQGGSPQQPQERGFIDRAADTASKVLNGVTFGYSDEIQALMGDALGYGNYGDLVEKSRDRSDQFVKNNPYVANGMEIAGAVGASLTPLRYLGAAVGAPMTAANLGRAAGVGAGLGSVYGFGEGEGGFENRLANVPMNAAIGAAGGVAGNALQAGVGRLGRMLNQPTGQQQLGVRPETYRIARSAGEMADADIPGGARARIAGNGPDAMIGDVMPGPLDYVINVGAGAPIARGNLNARVDRATGQVMRAMDDTLGAPQGVRQTARDIAGQTRANRAATYDAAYASPINYGTGEAGEKILGVMDRIPPRTLRAAIDEANDAMRAAGVRNQQILIDIADDGAVTFREMPNVQQLDEIKKALQTTARENVDQFGRRTAQGNRAAGLANDLRDALGDAVPEYNAATAAGADKIAQDQALELGQSLLKPSLTKEQVADGVRRFGPAERERAAAGVRAYLDELLGNVKATRSDPNIDQREAWKAIQDILTRNNRDKLESVLGPQEAAALFGELETAARSFGVRAGAAGNSATAGRQAFGSQVTGATARGRLPESMPRSVVDEVLSLPSRGFNAIRSATPAKIAARQDQVTRELAELLTGRTGQAALDAFDMLMQQPGAPGRLSKLLMGSGGVTAAVPRLASAPAVAPLFQPSQR